jgi:serine protease AprX
MRRNFLFLTLVLASGLASAGTPISPRLAATLSRAGSADHIIAWVSFADKGQFEHFRASVPQTVVAERSLVRRAKVRPAGALVDYTDLPVAEEYVAAVMEAGVTVRQRSRWLNAVSVIASPEQITRLGSLPFVSGIDLVARFGRNRSEEEIPAPPDPHPAGSPASPNDLDYGASLTQVAQIAVPSVHNSGNHAEGVWVGVFDNGFRLPNHESFDSMHIAATYDFVDHKVSVVPNNPSTSFGTHGVNTLSTIGGYKPGQLIGPAFGATFLLARTENDSSETPIEEDNWVAAIEWADSIGVDVTSTSLGYLTYDGGWTSWTWQDMDGNTTAITRAADMAVGRGILVVNSAGNSGYNAAHNTLGAPADGDSVTSMGAVYSSGSRVDFSSVGPTTSDPPRIKPDLMAMGSGVRVASSTNPTGYTYSSGTSFSCPLGAGAAALVLSANPSAAPLEVVAAMKATASNTAAPNNLIGWGIINTQAAIDYLQQASVGPVDPVPSGYVLEQNFPNPFNPSTTIMYALPATGMVSLKVYDVMGREIRTLVAEPQAAAHHTVRWDGTTSAGNQVPSGVYFYRLSADGRVRATRSMMLLK